MTWVIAFHEAAARELADAASFYEAECPGLGRTFLAEIEVALQLLKQFPEASPLLRGRLRRKVLPRFPYMLLYSLQADQIRILVVAHEKRRPFYWYGRQ
jgi:plasmid stabilization system protein ParE